MPLVLPSCVAIHAGRPVTCKQNYIAYYSTAKKGNKKIQY